MAIHIHLHRSRDASGDTNLWWYKPTTGIWTFQRACTKETASMWLAIYQKDAPNSYFKLSVNKPSKPPV